MGDRLLTLPVTASVPVAGKRYELPVCYAPEFAPDGDWVGQVCRLGADELVELHTAVDYTVYFTGYRPGFSFLGPTHHRLRIGRRKSPRTAVPAGALGLADRQTGIYPTVSPGGWQLIGNCPLSMITAGGNARLEAGDRVRFVSISKDHHAALLHGETEWKTA
jgi:inhibitor of KinA